MSKTYDYYADRDTPPIKPYGSIVWHSSNICATLWCDCGKSEHIDSSCFQYYQCSFCGRRYKVGCNFRLIPYLDKHLSEAGTFEQGDMGWDGVGEPPARPASYPPLQNSLTDGILNFQKNLYKSEIEFIFRAFVPSGFMPPDIVEMLLQPAAATFSDIGRTHNWRNYVPEKIQGQWDRMPIREKAFIFAMSEKRAAAEEWE